MFYLIIYTECIFHWCCKSPNILGLILAMILNTKDTTRILLVAIKINFILCGKQIAWRFFFCFQYFTCFATLVCRQRSCWETAPLLRLKKGVLTGTHLTLMHNIFVNFQTQLSSAFESYNFCKIPVLLQICHC